MSKTKAYRLIESVILIIVGILMSLSILNTSIIDIILGIVLILLGVLTFVLALSQSKFVTLLLPNGIIGAVLVAIGIAVISKYIVLSTILVNVIYVTLVAVGTLFIIDSIIRFIRKQNKLGIFELVIGALVFAFGLTLIMWEEFQQYVWVVFGILVAIFGLYLLIDTLIRISKTKPKTK